MSLFSNTSSTADMTTSINSQMNEPQKLSLRERLIKKLKAVVQSILLGLLILALLPFGLIALYSFVNPPFSNLMIWNRLQGDDLKYYWRDLDEIAVQLPRTIIMTEDAQFCEHNGVDWEAVGEVWEDFEEGKRTRGASTIPMQLAKNLFLWPSRSYLRKSLEVPLAYTMNLFWSKRRTIEIYVNVVQWGEGVYGAEAAAKHHFGSSAKKLSRRQSALLAASLPNPILRTAGKPGPLTRKMARRAEREGRNAVPYTKCINEGYEKPK